MVFKTSSANQSGVVRAGPTWPIRTTDCAAPGLSIRYSVRAAGGGAGGLASEPGGGAVRAVQRVPVRMLATVHDRGERDVRHRHRLVSLLHELRGAELSLPCDLRIGEAGP